MLDAKRRQILTGTERLWGIATWFPPLALAMVFALVLHPVLAPFQAPFESKPIDFTHPVVLAIGAGLVVIGAVIVRYHVMTPVMKLMHRFSHRAQFWQYCARVAVAARWHILAMSFAFFPFFFYLGHYALWAQLGLLLLVEHALEARKDRAVHDLSRSLNESGVVT